MFFAGISRCFAKSGQLKYSIFLSFILIFLSACATKFDINGVITAPDEKTLGELRSFWQADSLGILSHSAVPNEKSQGLLELIASSESSANGSCRNLVLERIAPEPLTVFTVAAPGGAYVTFSPKQFLEYWYVDACGKKQRWRVLDSKGSPGGVTALRYENYLKP